MSNKEENMMIGFTIVAIAGDARREVMAALAAAKENDFEQARQHIVEANNFITEAHKEQTQMLAKEAAGEASDISFIMVRSRPFDDYNGFERRSKLHD